MNSKSAARPWKFLAAAIVLAFAVWSFVLGSLLIGVIALGFGLLLLGLRVFLIVALRRGEVRRKVNPLPPPTAAAVNSRYRIAVVTVVATFGVFVGASIIAGVLLSGEVRLAAWVLVGLFTISAAVFAMALGVGRKRVLRNLEHPA